VFVTQDVDCAIAVGKYHPLKGQFTTRDLAELKSNSYPQMTDDADFKSRGLMQKQSA
jgi:hypothetical protein